jgi:hypothetical protein
MNTMPLWEADVLPLHHSREKHHIDNESPVYSAVSDIAIHSIQLHRFAPDFTPKWG